jgi:hypothetical protein
MSHSVTPEGHIVEKEIAYFFVTNFHKINYSTRNFSRVLSFT